MARSATATIALRATGRDRVRAALNGTVSDARRAQQQQAAASTRTAMVLRQLARSTAADGKRAAQTSAQATIQSEGAKQRAFRATAREAELTARAQSREDRRTARAVRRASSRRGLGDITGSNQAVLGAILGGVSLDRAISQLNERIERRISAIMARAGVEDVGAGLVNAQELDASVRRMVSRGRGGADLEANVAAVERDISNTAIRTGVMPADIAGGLQELQDLGGFDLGLNTMEQIGQAARSRGADFATMARAIGETAQAFDLLGGSAEDQRGAVDAIVSLLERSGQGPERFAQMREPMRDFIRATGARGRAGVEQFAAAQSVVRTATGADAGESAAMLGELGQSLRSRATRRALARRGIRGRTLSEVLPGLAQLSARDRGRLFGGGAGRALDALLTVEPGSLGRLGAEELAAGRQGSMTAFRAVQRGAEARTRRLGAEDSAEHLRQVNPRTGRFAWEAEAMTAFDQLSATPAFEHDPLTLLSTIMPRGFAGSMWGDRARTFFEGLPGLDREGRPITAGRQAGDLFGRAFNPLSADVEQQIFQRVVKGAATREKERQVAELGPEAAERFAAAMRARPLVVRVEGAVTVDNMPQTPPGTGAGTATPSGGVGGRRDTPPRARGR